MRRSHFDRVERPAVAGRGWLLLAGALCALGPAAPLAAQDSIAEQDTLAAAATDSVIGAAVSVSEDDASLELELSNGRRVALELVDGDVRADGSRIGSYEPGDELDRSWRALLEDAAMASTMALPAVLRSWNAPPAAGIVARNLEERLDQALEGVGGRLVDSNTFTRSPEDSIERLLARIDDLEEEIDEQEHYFHEERSAGNEFLHDLAEGVSGFFATLVWMGVLLAIGAALLFFTEGRLERVAVTAREEPLRSGLIGLAGAFLAIPFYVLVMLALAISILGIPLIIAWAPLFPLLVVLSGLTGWLAVAYGTGDALVNGRLQARPLFTGAGPVKRLFVGIALLLSPFLFGALFQMTSVLEWVGGLLLAVGIVGNMLVAAVGFGAVLVRGRDALDRHRERRAAARRARIEAQTPVAATQENTNV